MKKLLTLATILVLTGCPAPQGKVIPPLQQWSCVNVQQHPEYKDRPERCVDWTESVNGDGTGGIHWVTGPYYMAVVAQRYDPTFKWGHVLP